MTSPLDIVAAPDRNAQAACDNAAAVYGAALMSSDDVRRAQYTRINTRFQGAIETMKALAEARQ